MKRCPTCGQTYDDTQSFCANDGTRLTSDEPAAPSYDPMATIMAPPPPSTGEIKQPPQTFADPQPSPEPPPSPWMSPSEPAASPSGWTPPPPPQPFAAGQGQANGLAIGSLVCGALSILCLGFLLGIPAIIMGFMQLKKISADPANYGGKGLAIGGIVTGAIGTLLSLLGVIIWIILLATGGRF